MENNKWAGEEMSLERFTKSNPFTVPPGYFEDAGQRILSMVQLEDLKGDGNTGGFATPAGYFDGLTANIQSRINIDAAAGEGFNGYEVTAGYFDQLAANLQSRIAVEELLNTDDEAFAVPAGYFDELTANIESRIAIEEVVAGKEDAFTVPAGYFENMQDQISARIAVEEVLTAEPAFTVPDGYFEELNRNIVNKTVNKEVVLRKTIVRKMWASNTFKYATAACLALIIGAGAFLRDAGNTVVVPQHRQSLLHTQLSGVPVDEIKDYLELHIDATDNHGIMDNDKNINADALDEELGDYVDLN